MKTKLVVSLSIIFLGLLSLHAQTSFCPDDPPLNPWLADSPWPTFHRNSYRQASTCITGPVPGDVISIKSRTNIQGGTSPWVYLSDLYPTGERVLLQSNATHVFKHLDTPNGLISVDSLRIDFDPITSFGWSFVLSRDNFWYVPDPKYDPEDGKYSRIFKLGDADPTDPYSKIVIVNTINFEGSGLGRVGHLTINYNGEILFTAEPNEDNLVAATGILDQELNLLDTLYFELLPDEIVGHNSFPVDENNSWYVVTTHRLIRFDWSGGEISIGWQALYDFVHDGPTGLYAEGSGTTPTLMGYGNAEDKLIIIADGHQQNNLIAFWRELPPGWEGIPGQDIRFADSIQIPAAQAANNLFQSIENSPTVSDYSVAIAQFNGFLGYDCENEKGVQKFTWNTNLNQFELDWVNTDINMNGVLTYSQGSNLVYSSGKEEDCNYYLYGLNWDTGNLDLRILLGPEGTFLDDPFYDAGNNTIIAEDGSLYMPGGASLIKLQIDTPVSQIDNQSSMTTRIWPNPVGKYLFIEGEFTDRNVQVSIFDVFGRCVQKDINSSEPLDVGHLSYGMYFLEFKTRREKIVKSFIKH